MDRENRRTAIKNRMIDTKAGECTMRILRRNKKILWRYYSRRCLILDSRGLAKQNARFISERTIYWLLCELKNTLQLFCFNNFVCKAYPNLAQNSLQCYYFYHWKEIKIAAPMCRVQCCVTYNQHGDCANTLLSSKFVNYI